MASNATVSSARVYCGQTLIRHLLVCIVRGQIVATSPNDGRLKQIQLGIDFYFSNSVSAFDQMLSIWFDNYSNGWGVLFLSSPQTGNAAKPKDIAHTVQATHPSSQTAFQYKGDDKDHSPCHYAASDQNISDTGEVFA